jgi:hypothetical protein
MRGVELSEDRNMRYLVLSALSLFILGSMGASLPVQAATHKAKAAYHANCSGNPYSPKFQMGGCGGGASAKKKNAMKPHKAK